MNYWRAIMSTVHITVGRNIHQGGSYRRRQAQVAHSFGAQKKCAKQGVRHSFLSKNAIGALAQPIFGASRSLLTSPFCTSAKTNAYVAMTDISEITRDIMLESFSASFEDNQ